MRSNYWILALATFLLAGCASEDFDTTHQELAVEGPWEPPADVVAQAESYDITFVSAGPWVGTSGCSGSFTEGGRVFKEWLQNHWPQISHVGGYACRPINGNSARMSVHATGRAVDIHIPLDSRSADNGLGDPLANWLLLHADEIGIQSIIWDRWMWSPSRDPRSRSYGGAHPHHDHLHVELTPAAARMETPWFQGEMGAPDLAGCDEPLPAEGGVVDDSNDCFQAFGPSQFWRVVDGEGEGGSLRWTNAFQSDSPSNWARWRLNLAEAGTYRVEYNHVAEYAKFDSARYEVKFGEQTEEVFVDLSAGEDGWQELGEWEFAAGEGQWVAIHDNHEGAVGDDQHVLADAIRLVKPGTDPVVIDPQTPDITPPVVDYDVEEEFDDHVHDHDHEPMAERFEKPVHGRAGCQTAGGSPATFFSLLFALMLLLANARPRRTSSSLR